MKIEVVTTESLTLFAGLLLRQEELRKRQEAYRAQLDFELDVTRLKSCRFLGDWFTLHDRVREMRAIMEADLDCHLTIATNAVEISGHAIELQEAISEAVPGADAIGLNADVVISKAAEVEAGFRALGIPSSAYTGARATFRPAGPSAVPWKLSGPSIEIQSATFQMERFPEGWFLTNLEEAFYCSHSDEFFAVEHPDKNGVASRCFAILAEGKSE